MEIVTSYFGNQKALRKAGFKIGSIARYNPRFCTVDLSLPQFAPTGAMLKMSTEQYNIHFQKILKNIDINFIRSYLRDLEGRGYEKLALCCYEADINECHRKQVGEYLSIKLMREIKEFEKEPDQSKGDGSVQGSIF